MAASLNASNLKEQWASRVISFSSQYNSSGWAADKILGSPRVYPNYGDHTGSWAQGNCTANEFIEVEFPKKLFAKELHIYETLNGGAITRIQLRTQGGRWETVYTAQASSITESRIFKPELTDKDIETNAVRIEQDCTVSRSWCEIDAVKMCGTEVNLAKPPPITKLTKDLGQLVNNSEYSDVRILVDGQTFYGHKAILAVRCDYFRAMFGSGMKESMCRDLEIPNLSANAFTGVLQYIYTHDIDMDITDNSIIELIRVADRFGLEDLQKLCAVHLHSRITVDNVINIYLEAAEKLPVLDDIIEICANHMKNNREAILKRPNFSHLPSHIRQKLRKKRSEKGDIAYDIKAECIRLITDQLSTVSRSPDFARLPQEIMLEIIQASASRLKLE